MKITCGVDLAEISEIERALAESDGFISRFFGEEEAALFFGAHKVERIAAHFAAKEAFAKSLKTGIRGFSLKEVQLLRDECGAPFFKLSGQAEKLAAKSSATFEVSISHTKNAAVAMVVAYSD